MSSAAGGGHVARKRSTDAKGAFAPSSSLSGAQKKAALARSGESSALKRTLSRNASLTKGNLELHLSQLHGSRSVKEAAGDVRTVSHALEDALLSFESLDVEEGRTHSSSSWGGRGSGSGKEPPPFLPVTNIGESIVCLSRDEALIRETLRQKHAARLRKAATRSKDHYKYSLFAGDDPEEENLDLAPSLRELTPSEHIAIARSSILGNHLGLSNVSAILSTRHGRRARSRSAKAQGSLDALGSGHDERSILQQQSKRYDSEHSTILVYCDGREPIFIPKLDFSCLPNFRKPRMYNQQVAKGHMKKCGKHSKHKSKGLIGFLNLKFGF